MYLQSKDKVSSDSKSVVKKEKTEISIEFCLCFTPVAQKYEIDMLSNSGILINTEISKIYKYIHCQEKFIPKHLQTCPEAQKLQLTEEMSLKHIIIRV